MSIHKRIRAVAGRSGSAARYEARDVSICHTASGHRACGKLYYKSQPLRIGHGGVAVLGGHIWVKQRFFDVKIDERKRQFAISVGSSGRRILFNVPETALERS